MKHTKITRKKSVDIITIVQILAIISGLIIATTCRKNIPSPLQEAEIDIYQIHITPIVKLPSILHESSGLVTISTNRLWSHNDSGNSNELFLIDQTGSLIKTLTISNVQNIDWEDLAVDTQGRIYINDAGNNGNDRTDLAIYKIPNPENIEGNSVEAEIISFAFEDQTMFPPPANKRNFDIEGILWKDNNIYMFTKDRSTPLTGYTKQYVIPDTPGSHTAMLIDSFYVDNQNFPARITAADINHQTGEVVLLTRTRVLSFTNYTENKFFKGKVIDYQFATGIGQAEAIGFIDNDNLYITEEGTVSTPGFLYKVTLPRQ